VIDAPHGTIVTVDGDATPHELGRMALREALEEVGCTIEDIARDDRGAPIVPAGFVGSIAHKRGRAAAIAARATGDDARIGVDLEHALEPRQPIERRVMTERERATLDDRRVVTLYFAIKEAIYKAVDPFVRRYVGFGEVELDVDLAAPGACAVRVIDPARLPVAIAAWWCERDGYWLATARATKR
jgi:4'-phosphopantetheinyl transferase EntD